jgi:hypothetical protein
MKLSGEMESRRRQKPFQLGSKQCLPGHDWRELRLLLCGEFPTITTHLNIIPGICVETPLIRFRSSSTPASTALLKKANKRGCISLRNVPNAGRTAKAIRQTIEGSLQ